MHALKLEGNWLIVVAVLLGIVFGFLLVKSKMAWRKTLMDQLFLKNTFFVKTFLFSISVGAVLFFFCHKWGLVNLHIRPTYFWGATIGGLLTAIGLTLCGQIPSSSVAALGAGRLYVIWIIIGMLLAVPVINFISEWLSKTLYTDPVKSETLDKIFSSGETTCFWIAGISIIVCLFLEFIRTDAESE